MYCLPPLLFFPLCVFCLRLSLEDKLGRTPMFFVQVLSFSAASGFFRMNPSNRSTRAGGKQQAGRRQAWWHLRVGVRHPQALLGLEMPLNNLQQTSYLHIYFTQEDIQRELLCNEDFPRHGSFQV